MADEKEHDASRKLQNRVDTKRERERDEIKKMKRERISIRHYGRRVSLCLPSQTGIEKSEGGEAWPKENRKLRSSISISTRDEGAKVVRRDGVRMENNDSMPDICRRGRDKINSPLNPPVEKKSSIARHKYSGEKKRKKEKKCDPSNWMLVALCQKTRTGNVIFSRPVGQRMSLEESRGLSGPSVLRVPLKLIHLITL